MISKTTTAINNTRFTTFQERNNLLRLLDKVPVRERSLINAHVEGKLSMLDEGTIYFTTLNKFYEEYKNRQGTLFQEVTGNKIDKFIGEANEKLDSIGE
jgi:hypothetical protein